MTTPSTVATLAALLLIGMGCGDRPAKSDPRAAPEKEEGGSAAQPAVEETAIAGVALRRMTVLDGKLSLTMPRDFSVMGEEMLKTKYPSDRRPTLVYTNERGSINVAVNHTANRMPAGELASFHQHMEGMFRNLYPSATWHKSTLLDIGGRQWFLLDLVTPAADTEVRNMMVATSLEERLLMVTFNVVRELESGWVPVGEAIVQSLRVKE